eukprot:Phypoly_transcript_05503.p1 GENE.Phypoly_transcript_05503~~Phypoly_transcript_05503.p1  ORF type:complete len:583 (+),score=58.08 Phypoly_transcript_05503:104-1852(+)
MVAVLPRVARLSLYTYLTRVCVHPKGFLQRAFASTDAPRESDQFDIVIVGAGPSGLSAAIRAKQLSNKNNKELRVCVVEKGAEVGSHILSGAVIEPRALNELIPDWKEKGAPLNTPATSDSFYLLTNLSSFRLPTPPQMNNHGNYIISLGNLCKWLAKEAEDLGVEIYPGFAASELLYTPEGAVCGIATKDVGIGKDGQPTSNFARGMELKARATLLAEGCRGSLSKIAMKKFNLTSEDPQSYGIGLKEIWQIPPEKHKSGTIIHTIGWPLWNIYGGSFIYHMDPNLVSIGFVVGLDYENPYFSPYQEFQQFKNHPLIKDMLSGGTCISYGARAINEGGLQSIPKLTFPGGALVGCAAGFVNVPKIKGIHNAMKTGMLAAENVFKALDDANAGVQTPVDLAPYSDAVKESWVWEDLHKVRNSRPAFKYGLFPALAINAVDTYLFRGKAPFTLHTKEPDNKHLKPANQCTPITYPKPDGKLTFDLMTNVSRSGTNHEENQPPHLKVRDMTTAKNITYGVYAGPEGRYCPAGVYEWVDDGNGDKWLQINAQNCLHCKTCDIKDPTQNIDYTVPEGGGGPAYSNM